MAVVESPPLPRSRVADPPEVERPLLTLPSDLMLDGQYGTEWLVITQEKLHVYAGDPKQHSPRLSVPLWEIEEVLVDNLVGSGALLIQVAGATREIIRYTSARQQSFSQVVRLLERIVGTASQSDWHGEAHRLADTLCDEMRCPRCHLLLPEGTRVCPACMSKRKVLQRLAIYLRPYRRQVTGLTLLILGGSLLGLITPYLTRPLLDGVLLPQSPITTGLRLTRLSWIVMGMALSQLMDRAISIWRGRIAAVLTHRLAHDLRADLYQHLQMLSVRYYDKHQVGALMTRVTQDTEEVEQVLTVSAQFFLADLLMLVGISIILCVLDWQLFLLALAPLPVVLLLSRAFWMKMEANWQRCWHVRSCLNALLNDSLSGVRVVKAFAQEEREIARFLPQSAELGRAGQQAEQLTATALPMLAFFTSIGTLLVWFVGGQQVVGRQISPGTLITFVAYLGILYGPLDFLTRVADWLGRALASADRVFDILDSRPDVVEATDSVTLPQVRGEVVFQDVTFGYTRDNPVLHNLSLKVASGEMVGLVGHSGAGKSTTINLLCRFYDADAGQILLDGIDITRVRQADLRSQIGVVLQDTFLFYGTIAENIGYARPEATREDIIAAARVANAHDFIVDKPDGYDTRVGERGLTLSGGERQRIAIARAILHNPRILILDEATSAVDTDTEQQIQEAIARLVKGRTTFAIAHRLSTLRNADRIVVLKHGTVDEVGTHDELLARGGEFRRLVEMQQEMAQIRAVAR